MEQNGRSRRPSIWATGHGLRMRRSLAACLAIVGLLAIASSATGMGNAAAATVGGTLIVAVPTVPVSLDPSIGQNSNETWADLAYDPLIVLEANGSYKPGLALSWSSGPNNESFSMKLRPGVKFSDGTPLDANAVKAWIQHTIAFPGGTAATYFSALTTIDVTGPLSLTLRFSKPTPLVQRDFSQLLMVGDVASPEATSLNTTPDGAGEYMLDKSQTVVGDTYTYVPNPYYWNKKAIHWKQVVVKVISNPSAALSALETGQANVVISQSNSSIDAAKSAGLKYAAPSSLYLNVMLVDRVGTLVKALGDVRVRQALNYAIDRPAIAKALGGAPIDEMAVPGDDGYDPKLAKYYSYNPAKAKALLAAAGYASGFTLPMLATNVVGEDVMAEAIESELAQVGVKVQLTILTNHAQYVAGLGSGSYAAETLGWGRQPTYTEYQSWAGPNSPATFNPFHVHDSQLDVFASKLAAAPPSKADAVARQLIDRLTTQAWFLPVAVTPLVTLYSRSVVGPHATPYRINPYVVEIAPA